MSTGLRRDKLVLHAASASDPARGRTEGTPQSGPPGGEMRSGLVLGAECRSDRSARWGWRAARNAKVTASGEADREEDQPDVEIVGRFVAGLRVGLNATSCDAFPASWMAVPPRGRGYVAKRSDAEYAHCPRAADSPPPLLRQWGGRLSAREGEQVPVGGRARDRDCRDARADLRLLRRELVGATGVDCLTPRTTCVVSVGRTCDHIRARMDRIQCCEQRIQEVSLAFELHRDSLLAERLPS